MPFSRYYLCDLQVHTPADSQHRYGDAGGRDPNPDFARTLIRAHADAGVRVLAVTDHNRVDWFVSLRDAGDDLDVFVFPGTEISVNGCHLLVIWGREEEGFRLAQQFLDTCWDPGAARFADNGDPLPVGRGQVRDVVETARRHKALVLAPHSTARRIGIFASGVCRNRAEVVKTGLVSGFDVVGVRGADVLVNPRSEFGNVAPPWFITGDVRALDEAGERAVYLKLGAEPTLEGLRQAFLMPETRVRFPESLRDEWGHVEGIRFLESPEPAWPHFASIEIQGGFHNGLNITLAPGLNALIGGKGTGKSALIEITRYVTEGDEPQVEGLSENRKANFKANAEARIVFRDHEGQRYEIRRSGDGAPARLLRAGEDTGVSVGRRVTLRVFGQRELQRLGDEQEILREFVASTAEPGWSQAIQDESEVRGSLRKRGATLAEIDSELAGLEDIEADLADLREKIQQARDMGAEDLIARAAALNSTNVLVEAALKWPESVEEALSQVSDLLPAPAVPDGESVPAEIEEQIASLAASLSSSLEQLDRGISNAKDSLAEPQTTWETWVEEQRREIASGFADAGIADPEELTTSQRRAAELQKRIEDLPQKRSERDSLLDDRNADLEILSEIQRLKSRVVEEAARELSQRLGGRVRIKVNPLADQAPVEVWLVERLRGESIPRVQIGRLAGHGAPGLAAAIRDGEEAVEALGCSSGTAAKVARLTARDVRELEELPRPDEVVAEVNLGGPDGERWRPVASVSPGQRATALLALVLSSGSEPLIIDQPEDDLDNRHIYEEVVRVLREVCQSRQVIVATHNANIPVLGDAELIVALDADADRGRLLAIGGLEDASVAAHARRILEGGDEAFEARYRRYRGGGESDE